MSLNILTELSVNFFSDKHNSAEPSAQSVIVMQFEGPPDLSLHLHVAWYLELPYS